MPTSHTGLRKLRQNGKIRAHSSRLLASCCLDGVMRGPASGREHLNRGDSRNLERNADISLQLRLAGGARSLALTLLRSNSLLNREKYRVIQAISVGIVAIEFAQNAIPEPSFSPSAPV